MEMDNKGCLPPNGFQDDHLEDGEGVELELYKHYFAIQAEILLMQMKKQGILSSDEYKKIWSRVSEYADIF